MLVKESILSVMCCIFSQPVPEGVSKVADECLSKNQEGILRQCDLSACTGPCTRSQTIPILVDIPHYFILSLTLSWLCSQSDKVHGQIQYPVTVKFLPSLSLSQYPQIAEFTGLDSACTILIRRYSAPPSIHPNP